MTALALCGWVLAAVSALIGRDAARHRAEQVARACHEVRGPLHAAGLALHGVGGTTTERERVAAARGELERAALAVADLDAARDGRHAPRAAVAVDVGVLVARHAAAWRALAGEAGGELRIHVPRDPAVVLGDPVRLAQATANLVANAAEHGGGEIGVHVSHERGAVVIEVADAGAGLNEPVATIAARARGGLGRRGRGLAIVTAIAGEHGGRLAAAPSTGGARLRLELPARPAEDVA